MFQSHSFTQDAKLQTQGFSKSFSFRKKSTKAHAWKVCECILIFIALIRTGSLYSFHFTIMHRIEIIVTKTIKLDYIPKHINNFS